MGIKLHGEKAASGSLSNVVVINTIRMHDLVDTTDPITDLFHGRPGGSTIFPTQELTINEQHAGSVVRKPCHGSYHAPPLP